MTTLTYQMSPKSGTTGVLRQKPPPSTLKCTSHPPPPPPQTRIRWLSAVRPTVAGCLVPVGYVINAVRGSSPCTGWTSTTATTTQRRTNPASRWGRNTALTSAARGGTVFPSFLKVTWGRERGVGGKRRTRSEGRLERSDSIISPTHITNKLPLVASLLVSPIIPTPLAIRFAHRRRKEKCKSGVMEGRRDVCMDTVRTCFGDGERVSDAAEVSMICIRAC